MAPNLESVTRTDAGLASQLRVSVMRLARRLRNERDPDNQLGLGQLSLYDFKGAEKILKTFAHADGSDRHKFRPGENGSSGLEDVRVDAERIHKAFFRRDPVRNHCVADK